MYQFGSKIKRAGLSLCSLCKFQLFAVSNEESSSRKKTAELLGGKTLMSSYILCKFWSFQREFHRNYLVYRAQFFRITELVMRFQYSEILFC